MSEFQILEGDCLDVMRTLRDNSVDAVVTDPPYGLSFMGKQWDHGVPAAPFWVEALRVAKPGAHIVAFGGTRTFHRLTCAIEDAGWEIRDCLSWLYGSGFPKSLDVSKAIDKAAGVLKAQSVRFVVAGRTEKNLPNPVKKGYQRPAPVTDRAKDWCGWGTALKPAWEPIILARKPLAGTVAANVVAHGTGAINVDACRIGEVVETWPKSRAWPVDSRDLHHNYTGSATVTVSAGAAPAGRWPANILLDESAAAMLDAQSDSASRFFYTAKASREEREAGLEDIPLSRGASEVFDASSRDGTGEKRTNLVRKAHPTVKPTDLMRWLVRLVTPRGGLVLDPFTGSGSTGCAAVLEGMRFIGIEREPEYCAIARARIAHHANQLSLPL